MLHTESGRPRIVLALIAILLLTACSNRTPGQLIVDDETELLSRARVAESAEPLLQRGATVAIFIVERGNNTTNGNNLNNRLDRVGLRDSGRIASDAVAIYISYEPRNSELRVGETWSKHLPDDKLSSIRADVLDPALRDGDITTGVVESLKHVDSAIAWGELLDKIKFLAIIYVFFSLSRVFGSKS